jgi:3'-phosphoadenosine 5'-phosphosulfate sulfotransferase (PAPS reductase)/FAD synthetase
LLDIARKCFPDIEAVFVNTGLEYPEIQQFVKSFDNVTILRPKMRFDEVIKQYGYPLISKEVSKRVGEYHNAIAKGDLESSYAYKEFNGLRGKEFGKSFYNKTKWKPLVEMPMCFSHKCCDVMKKKPAKDFEKETDKKPIVGSMADESLTREADWIKNGCNAFNGKRPVSNPMSFWTEQDVLQYIKRYDLPIASVYGEIVYETDPEQMRFEEFGIDESKSEKLTTTGCKRTGCIFCAFGCHLEKEPSRFQMLKETHPRQYEYCIGGGEFNEQGIWQPSKEGLGMGYVFDELNKIYGENFIRYK